MAEPFDSVTKAITLRGFEAAALTQAAIALRGLADLVGGDAAWLHRDRAAIIERIAHEFEASPTTDAPAPSKGPNDLDTAQGQAAVARAVKSIIGSYPNPGAAALVALDDALTAAREQVAALIALIDREYNSEASDADFRVRVYAAAVTAHRATQRGMP